MAPAFWRELSLGSRVCRDKSGRLVGLCCLHRSELASSEATLFLPVWERLQSRNRRARRRFLQPSNRN